MESLHQLGSRFFPSDRFKQPSTMRGILLGNLLGNLLGILLGILLGGFRGRERDRHAKLRIGLPNRVG
jgi:hypothetical protein